MRIWSWRTSGWETRLRGQKQYARGGGGVSAGSDAADNESGAEAAVLLQAGESYDLMGEHAKAVEQYQAVIAAGSDTAQGDAARKYMKSGYVGK